MQMILVAVVSIYCTASPMRSAVQLRLSTVMFVLPASITTWPAIVEDCSSCWPVSGTELDSSSDDEATV